MKTKIIHLALAAAAAFCLTSFSIAQPVIIVDQSESGIFPAEWLISPIHAEAEPLPANQHRHCRDLLKKDLAKYPARLLKANLKKIHVVGKIRYRGVSAGGTNSRSIVYLAKNEKFTDNQFQINFHAEFSSVLLRNHPDALDTKAWNKINPTNFTYGEGGVAAIQKGEASLRRDTKLNGEGFLHQYGKASLQEDFNSYASRLLKGDGALWEAMDRHPKVKQKAELTMAFYRRLHPSFTPDFFKSLR